MANFIDVLAAQESHIPGQIECIIIVDDGNGHEQWPFTYSPTDTYGLSPDVRQFFVDHPDFPILPYVPPEG